MNCKPKDLAILVRNTLGMSCIENLIGSPVRVTTVRPSRHGAAWNYAGPRLMCPSCGAVFAGLLDADLQPIRGQKQPDETPVVRELETQS